MRGASLCSSLLVVCACGAFDPDDGTRALTISTVSSWTEAALGGVAARVCVDDGTVHADDWGAGCAVASGSSDFQGGLRIANLEPEVYQLYLEGPAPWGAHATLVSLVAENGAVSVGLDPQSVAGLQVAGDYELGLPQVRLRVDAADMCGSNELVVDLPSFASGETEGADAASCMEIENNDFVGTAAFEETARTPMLDECGGAWCEEWTVVSQTPRRRGTINGVLEFMDQKIQLDGEWLE